MIHFSEKELLFFWKIIFKFLKLIGEFDWIKIIDLN